MGGEELRASFFLFILVDWSFKRLVLSVIQSLGVSLRTLLKILENLPEVTSMQTQVRCLIHDKAAS